MIDPPTVLRIFKIPPGCDAIWGAHPGGAPSTPVMDDQSGEEIKLSTASCQQKNVYGIVPLNFVPEMEIESESSSQFGLVAFSGRGCQRGCFSCYLPVTFQQIKGLNSPQP